MSLSIPKAMAELKQQGLLFKGKGLTEQSVKALKALAPFVGGCKVQRSFFDVGVRLPRVSRYHITFAFGATQLHSCR